MRLLLVLANWIPDPSPEFGSNPKPMVALMIAGFFIAIAGHITRTKTAVALGIGMIFLATFLIPLGLYVSKS
jgi:hypothetical protein